MDFLDEAGGTKTHLQVRTAYLFMRLVLQQDSADQRRGSPAMGPLASGHTRHLAQDDARCGRNTRVTRSRNRRVGTYTSIGGSACFLPETIPAPIACHPPEQCDGASRVLAISAELSATECVRAPEMSLQAVRDASVARRARWEELVSL